MRPRVDWIQLTESAEITSLWDTLHDGEIRAITSDLHARTVRLECEVDYLRSFHNLPEDLTFTLQLEEVTTVRVTKWTVWPGEFVVPKETSRPEEESLIAEYHAKWREESESWNAFESAITSGILEITDATLATGKDGGGVALKLEVMRGSSFHELFLSAGRLEVTRSDRCPFDLAAFLQLGHAYWEAFANR